ncbi:hypothetical protein BO70DRAFT_363353 [Aspergillus heteromorphus CBS 117.55]|uniref:Uncharacterized protein n=1 Tax=Aspergillus heteromorphus CBS 117.55 TaxID=1448321 RepID=A0A317VVP0_9EURO|nr:uncharacterized protein BO70DRAFT_363353 [Aspergillus heteromorphus CBS 117.55]PWY77421.1 hypothetical protein BO70DRAFT_363353 [Aspergillus heteromorphus CBS 117.55]
MEIVDTSCLRWGFFSIGFFPLPSPVPAVQQSSRPAAVQPDWNCAIAETNATDTLQPQSPG